MTTEAHLAGNAAVADLTEAERLARELAQVRAEFQDFVYTVSHDLRAPLRHINAFAQIIEEDLPNAPADIRAHLATIRQSAQLLTQQLDGLTSLSRLAQRRVNLQVVDVVPITQAVARELALRHPQQPVQWQLAQDVPPVWADAELLAQLFTQVLDNAFKFSRDRSPAMIAMTWQRVTPDQPGAPHWVEISVRDNGVGFAPEQADKLFRVFAKLHSPKVFEGLGLGLVTSRKLMAQLGGHMAMTAAVNAGCCVTLRLPLAVAT